MRSRDMWREMVDVELNLAITDGNNDKLDLNHRAKRSSRDSLCCTW